MNQKLSSGKQVNSQTAEISEMTLNQDDPLGQGNKMGVE